jgi:ketol-acid reductoisomerase
VKLLQEDEIDPSPLNAKRVAVIGFGNQGRAQALNLRDSGIDIIVGLRDGSQSEASAKEAGLNVASLADAVEGSDLVMLLAPDERLGEIYSGIESRLRKGAALGFSHGLAVQYCLLKPRADLDVFLVAPKGPGTALRRLYEAGKGMIALWAVAQDASGRAPEIALAYGRAIGCARAGLIASTFEEEAVADLFNENAVVWGGVPELLRAGFETLVEAGITPEVAYLECVGELKLLAELIDARGIAGMREAISNTAELGAAIGGPAIVGAGVRTAMDKVLKQVRSGEFAAALREEALSGYPKLTNSRESARSQMLEQTFRKLRDVGGA